MTCSKEDLSRAFNQVLSERVPDLSDIPDHVFSERFETRMNKLIRREAAHPWAVSHTTARNLLIAALIAILLFALSMSVSGIRNSFFNFFTQHFDTHDDVIFDDTERTKIEHVYEITDLPEGFSLTNKTMDPERVIWLYESTNGNQLSFTQKIPLNEKERSVDNEKTKMSSLEINNQIFVYVITDNTLSLAWEKDGYEFWLDLYMPDISLEEAIQIFYSIN